MHRVRNADLLNNTDAIRELIRQQFPSAGRMSGLVASDVDLVLRAYGPEMNSDQQGRYLLAEFKHGNSSLTNGQNSTFRQIDEDLRAGGSQRYMGFWKVNYTLTPVYDDPDLDRFEPRCVRFDRCTRLYDDLDEDVIQLTGHERIHRFLSTLDLPLALNDGHDITEPW